MSVDKAKLDELEAKYGRRIAHIKSAVTNEDGSPEWEIVLRPPKRPEYQRMRGHAHDPAMKAEAQEQMVRALCVYPDREALTQMLDEWPGITEADGVTEALKRLTGMQARVDSKS